MKHLKGMLLLVLAMVCFTSVSAQSSKAKGNSGSIAVADTAYYCPMKCEGSKTYDKAGRCPKCNMFLKAVPTEPAAAYQCPMRCEGEKAYSKEGKCPECNMALKKVKTQQPNKSNEAKNHHSINKQIHKK